MVSRSFLNLCFWAYLPQGVWGERGALNPGLNLLALPLGGHAPANLPSFPVYWVTNLLPRRAP